MSDNPTDPPTGHRVTAFDLVSREPWAITPDMLHTIAAIARREHERPEAVEARQGRPLQNSRTVTQRGNVALVPVTGPVFRYANLFTALSGATSLDVLAKDFTAAVDDPRTDSIILVMDTPGGQASGIAEFAQMIRASPKRVVAYVSGNAASAGYWMAAAAHEIVMSRTGAVGSIGTVLTVRTNKDDGSVEIVSSQSPNKRPDFATEQGRVLAQNHVDRLTSIFIEDVANYRGVSVDNVLADFGQGDMRIGADAVDLGMADRESTLESLIAELNSTSSGDRSMSTTATKPGTEPGDKPVINREYLAANHAELLATLEHDAHAAGARAECDRIKAVEAAALPGHEELIASLKFDGKTSGAEAAAQVIGAEKTKRTEALANIRSNAAAPVPGTPEPPKTPESKGEDADAPLEERAKATWDGDKDLRAEFGTFEAYHAYRKAEDKGLIKVLKK
ncbi:S49 family peptidase [Pseudomonas sp. Irchel 3A7]|uniref:S49 family peptidase n=1 Tax=Pseudomonas sp. Irchel 3A7 TaxID=2008913 RepID=UPI000BA2FFA1|nr:S49 family peptidase [Pseudomonas sp. Irchel 3A7]